MKKQRKKSRISYSILLSALCSVIITLFLSGEEVWASIPENSKMNTSQSEEHLLLGNGDKIPYWKKKGKDTYYLYETHDADYTVTDLGSFSKRPLMYGKYNYMRGVDNQGNPKNREVYQFNETTAAKTWENLMRDIQREGIGKQEYGISYRLHMKEQYGVDPFTVYPEAGNFLFKHTLEERFERRQSSPENYDRIFFYNPNASIPIQSGKDEAITKSFDNKPPHEFVKYGNPRLTWNQHIVLSPGFEFPSDILNLPFHMGNYDYKAIPWVGENIIKKGQIITDVEKALENLDLSKYRGFTIAKTEEGQDKKDMLLAGLFRLRDIFLGIEKSPNSDLNIQLINQLNYHNIVAQASNPQYKVWIEAMTAKEYGYPIVINPNEGNLLNDSQMQQVYCMLRYANIQSLGGHGYGQMDFKPVTERGTVPNDGRKYFSIYLPKLYQDVDLVRGTYLAGGMNPDNPVYPIDNNSQLAMAVREWNDKTPFFTPFFYTPTNKSAEMQGSYPQNAKNTK